MEYIQVTKENIEQEHICCAIASNKDILVSSKKDWLKALFDDGLIFLKSVERGKCFIEYIPADKAWVPLIANDYMYINCLWVSGSLKRHGYSNDLLNSCIKDSKEKGKQGLCILSSSKKRGFLADPKYLKYKGFKVCDEATNGIQLWYLPFNHDVKVPSFKESAKKCHIDEQGFVLYYTNQCPFNGKYVPILKEYIQSLGYDLKIIHIKSKEEAQDAPIPNTTYALFYNGNFITNEILNENKFNKIIQKWKL